MTLGPTTRTSAVDACETALRAAILEGRFAPGDRLPPERNLAETLGVNRTTLRSALSRLREAGLVAPRQGDGCIVLDYRESGGLELVAALLDRANGRSERASIARDLLAIRRAVASVVLERLHEGRPSAGAQRTVGAAVAAFARAAAEEAEVAELAERDRAVLGALVEASKSPVIGLLLHPVARLLAGFPELAAALYAEPAANVAAHAAVLAWLEAPSRAEADVMLAAMAAHDAHVLDQLERAPRRGSRPHRHDRPRRKP